MEEYETGLKSNCIPIAIVDGKNNGVGLLPTAERNIPGRRIIFLLNHKREGPLWWEMVCFKYQLIIRMINIW